MRSATVGFSNWIDENWYLSVALICRCLVMSEFECLYVSESSENSLSHHGQSVSVVLTCCSTRLLRGFVSGHIISFSSHNSLTL